MSKYRLGSDMYLIKGIYKSIKKIVNGDPQQKWYT